MLYDVIISGGGPTGVALALELGLNNIKTLVLEKYANPLLSPRAQFLNTRSMELFMRWNIAKELRSRQLLPAGFPLQGIWCSKLNGVIYGTGNFDQNNEDTDISPERALRIPLWITEEIMRSRLKNFPSVTFLKEQEVTDISLKNDKVIVTAKKADGKFCEYQGSYLVGCDGANSIVRKKMEIPFQGLSPQRRVINVVFESDDFAKKITVGEGILYYLLENQHGCALGPVDLRRGLWYAQVIYRGEEQHIEQINLDSVLEEITGVSFSKKIIQSHFWNMQIQIAESFSKENRVFLVGDSAHAFAPTGGFGLNTGLGDVTNLGWKLAAVIQQCAEPALLKTYEQERRDICLRNLNAAQKNADDLVALREQYNLSKDDVAFAKGNASLAAQHAQSSGLTMGYAYYDSPLTQLQKNQSTEPMPKDIYNLTPLPGHFLPHIWVDKNCSIYHLLSATVWTLIVSKNTENERVDLWKKKLSHLNLKIESVPENSYPFRYLLVRPDWHIAFAGNELDECEMVI